MGLDAEIFVVGEKSLTQNDVDAFNDYMRYRAWPEKSPGDDDWQWNILALYDHSRWMDHPHIQANWQTLWRYYGPGYERGRWPEQYLVLRCLIEKFPEHRIVYRDDCNWHPEDVVEDEGLTLDDLEETWKYYLSDEGDGYYRRFR